MNSDTGKTALGVLGWIRKWSNDQNRSRESFPLLNGVQLEFDFTNEPRRPKPKRSARGLGVLRTVGPVAVSQES
jgi:hypothetical protein